MSNPGPQASAQSDTVTAATLTASVDVSSPAPTLTTGLDNKKKSDPDLKSQATGTSAAAPSQDDGVARKKACCAIL